MTTMLEVQGAQKRSDVSNAMTQGTNFPLGATPYRQGGNSSVYSKHATWIELRFEHVDDAKAARTIRIDPAANRT
ncbi:MAG: hypothetical protein P4L90_27355 [Rhodopila sp.]|nr:hypothetical protein [Rhodopila sp.]